jgi:hypothetical protein
LKIQRSCLGPLPGEGEGSFRPNSQAFRAEFHRSGCAALEDASRVLSRLNSSTEGGELASRVPWRPAPEGGVLGHNAYSLHRSPAARCISVTPDFLRKSSNAKTGNRRRVGIRCGGVACAERAVGRRQGWGSERKILTMAQASDQRWLQLAPLNRDEPAMQSVSEVMSAMLGSFGQ